MTNLECNEKFQKLRNKLLTNWKVLEDKGITEESTPSQIIGYIGSLESEKWAWYDLIDLLTHWSKQVPKYNKSGREAVEFTQNHCNQFFKKAA